MISQLHTSTFSPIIPSHKDLWGHVVGHPHHTRSGPATKPCKRRSQSHRAWGWSHRGRRRCSWAWCLGGRHRDTNRTVVSCPSRDCFAARSLSLSLSVIEIVHRWQIISFLFPFAVSHIDCLQHSCRMVTRTDQTMRWNFSYTGSRKKDINWTVSTTAAPTSKTRPWKSIPHKSIVSELSSTTESSSLSTSASEDSIMLWVQIWTRVAPIASEVMTSTLGPTSFEKEWRMAA